MAEVQFKKLLPELNSIDRPYWEGCKRHELLIQKCLDCGNYIFYPRLYCPYCMSANIEWRKASGKGEIYSYSIVYRPISPAYQEDVPYIVAFVELEEGVRMMSNIIECNPEELKVETKVEVVFDDVTDEITLPKFKPV